MCVGVILSAKQIPVRVMLLQVVFIGEEAEKLALHWPLKPAGLEPGTANIRGQWLG